MKEISLKELLYIFKRRFHIIIVSIIGTLILSWIINFFIITPQYETFTTLMVGRPNSHQSGSSSIDYNDILLNQRLVPTYGELIESKLLAQEVTANLNLEIPYDRFQEKISVGLVEDTEIIKIQVKDSDKELAAKIANEVSNQFIKMVKSRLGVENIQIIDEASIPEKPISPRKALNTTIGAIFGLMIGIFLVLLLEYLDDTFKTSEDAEGNLYLPVLGVIPAMTSVDEAILIEEDSEPFILEAFRGLRTNIRSIDINKKIKTLAITSSTRSEGKSTIASNLAMLLAQENQTVLIIDCDLRRPRLHRIFNITNTWGLTNILMGDNIISHVLYRTNKMGNLSIIPAGPTPLNPSELIRSKRMEYFLGEIKERYDMVILDTPPTGIIADATVLSAITDGTLVIIQAGRTEIDQAKYAKKLLDKSRANIIGTVLNHVPVSSARYEEHGYE